MRTEIIRKFKLLLSQIFPKCVTGERLDGLYGESG